MQYLKNIGALTLLIVSAIGCDTTSVHRFPVSLAPKETSKLLANVEPVPEKEDSIVVHVGTFLGNEKRNYSGNYQSDSLHRIWKTPLGSGTSTVNSKIAKEITIEGSNFGRLRL